MAWFDKDTPVSLPVFLRGSPGSYTYFETPQDRLEALRSYIQCEARRSGARIQQQTFRYFITDSPVYGVKVTLLKPGAPFKPPGRKKQPTNNPSHEEPTK